MLIALLSGASFVDANPAKDAAQKELKLFQGKWTAVAMFDNGTAVPEDKLKITTMIVDGNKWVIKEGDKVSLEGTFKIDPTKKVKTIDAVVKFDDKEILSRGIFQIDGDTRKSCFAMPDEPRPDRFRKDKGFLYLEWKRAK
ncbi:MAG: TIGR03067 domain-containing protein [Planctomycetes bacterium]|nr:TIGR03067 domain-containing protein [Planctomycetota bacterium]